MTPWRMTAADTAADTELVRPSPTTPWRMTAADAEFVWQSPTTPWCTAAVKVLSAGPRVWRTAAMDELSERPPVIRSSCAVSAGMDDKSLRRHAAWPRPPKSLGVAAMDVIEKKENPK
jgi:hypothetical protein